MQQHDNGKNERGQILALFAISATVIILLVGLVIDGGNALSQRRVSQNTSDFAALAGARIVAQWIGNDATNGTDANVKAAINTTVAANGGDAIVFGSPDGPTYVDANGAVTGFVGAGVAGAPPPANTVGVRVSSSKSFGTYFLGIVGWNQMTASSTATARGGFATGGPVGDVFPAGISLAFFQTYPFCIGDVGTSVSLPAAAPDAGQPQRPRWLRMAQVRRRRQVRGLRPRHEHRRRAATTASRSCRARSVRRRIATAAARPSTAERRPTQTRSTELAAFRATRPAPTARTTSTTRSS